MMVYKYSLHDPDSGKVLYEGTAADLAAQDWGGVILVSNPEFVAVRSSHTVKIYPIDELKKRIAEACL